jgi:hypothetical protein
MMATFFSQPVVWSTSLVEVLTILTVLAGGFTLYRKVECHQPGCHRLGHFQHGAYKLCRIHHPVVPAEQAKRKHHIANHKP